MNWMSRINRGQTNIDFLVWWKRGLAVSAVLVIASIVSLCKVRKAPLNIRLKFGKRSPIWLVPMFPK